MPLAISSTTASRFSTLSLNCASTEYATLYSGVTSNTALVTKYYTNILERTPDAGGLAFWASQLDSGRASTAQVLEAISDSPENIAAVAPLIANGFEYVPYG